MSQAALADRVGVSRKWLIDFERETGHASIDAVLRLMDVLGLELDLVRDRSAAAESTDHVDLDALLDQRRR